MRSSDITKELVPDITLRDNYKDVGRRVGAAREKFVAREENVLEVKMLCGPKYDSIPLDWFRGRIPYCAKNPDKHGGDWNVFETSNHGAVSYADLESSGNQEHRDWITSGEFKVRVSDPCKERAGWRCQLCGVRGAVGTPLQCHHRDYATMKGPGEINDVICLCRPCHSGYHKKIEEPRNKAPREVNGKLF